MSRPATAAISPFFIVSDAGRTIAFYRDKLGFEVTFQEPDQNPFFAIVRRDGAQLFVKAVDENTPPLPNSTRHPSARWDAYVYAPDPDALAAEFTANGTAFSEPLQDTHDGLRGFEIHDPDGYVLFFGRPQLDARAARRQIPQGRIHIRVERCDAVHVDHSESLRHCALRAGDAHLTARPVHLAVTAHQHADPRAVDVIEPGHIHHQLAGTVFNQALDRGFEAHQFVTEVQVAR